MSDNIPLNQPDQNDPVSEDEQRYRLLFDSSPVGIGIAGLDGTILDANPAILEIFRSTKDELVGTNIKDRYVNPSDRQQMIELMRRDGKVDDFQVQLKRKDGTTIWVSANVNNIVVNGKNAVQSMLVDITERKAREDSIRNETTRFMTLMDDSLLPILIMGLERTFKYANKAVVELFGYSKADDFVTYETASRYSPDSFALIESWWQEARSGTPEFMAGYTYEIVRPDGETRQVQIYNKPILWDGESCQELIYLDVTEQIRTDRERQALTRASRAVLSGTDFTDTVREIFDCCRDITGAVSGYIALLEDESWENILFIVSENIPVNVDPSLAMPVRGIRAEVYENRQSLYENDVQGAQWVQSIPVGHMSLQNILYVPLVVEEKAIGIIVLANKPEAFTDEDVAGVEAIAEICAIALIDGRSREQLESSEEKYRLLFETVSEGFALHELIYDDEGNPYDYRYLEVNPAFLRQLGYKSEDLLGKTAREIILTAEGHVADRISLYAKVVETGEPVRFEQYSPNLGKWFSKSAFRTRPGQFATLFQDITERKKAEEALITESTRKRILIDQSRDGIVVLDMQGNLFEANTRFAEMIGYHPSELQGLTVFDWETVYDRQSLIDSFVTLDESGSIIETKHRRRDGSEYDVEISANAAYMYGEKFIFCVCRDITEKKQIQQSLLDTEERLRNSIITSPLSIWLFNVQNQLVYLNRAALQVMGYDSLDEILTIPTEKLVTQESFMTVQRWRMDRQKGVALPSRFNLNIVRKDGVVRNLKGFRNEVMWEGEPHIQIVYEDITEQIELEKSLIESETRFRQLFENMTSGVALYQAVDEGKDFVFVDFNKAAEEIDTISRSKVLGRKVTEVFPAVENYGLLDVFRRVWETGVGEIYPVTMYKDDRISGWRENRVYKLPSGEIVSIYDDLSELKKAEERENSLRAELITQSRLATVGEMAAGIAHEINNPLTGVIGFAALLLDGDVPPDIRKDLTMIYEGSQRVASITSRMLAFARQQQPELSIADINEILDNTLAMRSYEMDSHAIKASKLFAEKLSMTLADATQIQQVFLNIILNAESALKKTGKGGTITVRTEESDGIIGVTITDDGPGIPADIVDRIFDPFFTTNPVGEGTGLGLSVSYGIVKRHGGNIYVESEYGKGATFVVELPVVRGDPVSIPQDDRKEPELKTGARILLIDDEEMVQRFLEGLLEKHGYRLVTAGTGEDGLEELGQNDYDVILLDVKLPGISGIEVYNTLLKKDASIRDKILLITGDVMNDETVDFIKSSGVSFIEKPFKYEVLLEKINKILGSVS